MKNATALVAHPYPIVVDALATIVVAAGFSVACAGDEATTAAGLAALPDLALIAAALGGVAAATRHNLGARTIVIEDDVVRSDNISLTDPVHRIAAQIAAVVGDRRPAGAGPFLTVRELDVARLVAAGQRNRVIAAGLGISEGTVKMHLHNVYAKLGLQSRTQLAMSLRHTPGA